MEQTLNLQEIKNAISLWNNRRANSTDALDILASGHYLTIEREYFETLINKGIGAEEYIHAYVGVVIEDLVERLNFFLIDASSDGPNGSISDAYIYQTPFKYGFSESHHILNFEDFDSGTQLTVGTALERGFRWLVNRKSYIENIVSPEGGNTGLFQVIHFQFGDLINLFEGESEVDVVYAVFGMRGQNSDVEPNTPELIFWQGDFKRGELVEDVALPIPPFEFENNYQLLSSSISDE